MRGATEAELVLREGLVAALQQALPIVSAAAYRSARQQRVWKVQGGSGWVGLSETRPELIHGFVALMHHIDEDQIFQPLVQTIEEALPGVINRTIRVGMLSEGRRCTLYTMLTSMIAVVYHCYDSLSVGHSVLESAADDLIRSVRTRTITYRYLAPIRDFTMQPAELLLFPNGVRVRPLLENEATRLYSDDSVFKPASAPPSLFTFAGEVECSFAVGDEAVGSESLRTIVSNQLAEVQQAMMSYKAGRVMHDWVSLTYAKPCPLGTLNMAFDTTRSQRTGPYALTSSDLPQLVLRFTSLARADFPALTRACERLADSERRQKPIDGLMDAVVGLEMLLLGGNDREGLRFRFALNYATLLSDVSGEDSRRRFKEASDVYKIRSQVVHAGVFPGKPFLVAGEKLTLETVAQRAQGMLRETINVFLSLEVPKTAAARDRWLDEFWESGYFGVRSILPIGRASNHTTDQEC